LFTAIVKAPLGFAWDEGIRLERELHIAQTAMSSARPAARRAGGNHAIRRADEEPILQHVTQAFEREVHRRLTEADAIARAGCAAFMHDSIEEISRRLSSKLTFIGRM
jgi:hypothetical protein